MTTIATDGVTIAADGLRCVGTERIALNEQKIRVRKGYIFAFTGDYPAFEPAIEWFMAGAKRGEQPPAAPDGSWSLIVIASDGKLCKYTDKYAFPEPYPYPATFGIGCDYAMAAMHCGKSPREAIELASKLNVYTGGEITEIDISVVAGRLPVKVAAE